MYDVLQHSQGPFWTVSRRWFEMPFNDHGRSRHVGTPAELFPFIAALRTGCSSTVWHCSFTLKRSRKTRKLLYDFHWAKHCYVRNKCLGQVSHKCNIDCHIAAHAVSCLPLLPPTQDIDWHAVLLLPKKDSWQGLLRTQSITHHPPFIPNHVLLNNRDGASPTHLLIVQYVKSSVMQQCHLWYKPFHCHPVLVHHHI